MGQVGQALFLAAATAPGTDGEPLDPVSRWIPPVALDNFPLLLLYPFVIAAGLLVGFVVICRTSWWFWWDVVKKTVGTPRALLATAAIIALVWYLQRSGRVELLALYRNGLDALDDGPAAFWGVLVAVLLGGLLITAGFAAVWGLLRWAVVVVAK